MSDIYLNSARVAELWSKVKQYVSENYRGYSNPNLLDNWYFADPINQRGQTEYTVNNGVIYTLDRWRLSGFSTASAKLEVVDGGVRITSGNAFSQIIENSVAKYLTGKTVTVSALMDIEAPPAAGQIGIVADNEWIGFTPLPETAGTDILVSATIPIGDVSSLTPWIYSAADGAYKLKAIKLELGSIQTLAHQDADGSWVLNDPPPNKALELVRCQRYFQIAVSAGTYDNMLLGATTDNTSARITVPLTATLRSKPAISFSGQFSLVEVEGTSFKTHPVTAMSCYTLHNGFMTMSVTTSDTVQIGAKAVLMGKEVGAYFAMDSNL